MNLRQILASEGLIVASLDDLSWKVNGRPWNGKPGQSRSATFHLGRRAQQYLASISLSRKGWEWRITESSMGETVEDGVGGF